jgi:F-type H+-transporting ATPase subunit b
MNLNATCLGQLLTFFVLVWFTVKYVWPSLQHTIHARAKIIQAGLAASEKGHVEHALAIEEAKKIYQKAHDEANVILKKACHEADHLVMLAKQKAIEEARIVLNNAKVLEQQLKINMIAQMKEYYIKTVCQGVKACLHTVPSENILLKSIKFPEEC